MEKGLSCMKKIDHNAHSVYLMYYHLIMVVKYRRKVIDNPISERAKEIWEHIAPRYGIVLEEWNHDIDHVHVMFRAQPRTELSKFINAYKSASSRLLKKEYPEIREKLLKARERKSIEHSISFPNLSDRRTEDTSGQNIWLLSFPVQSNA